MIDNSRNSAYDFAGLISGQPIFCVTEFECGIVAGEYGELIRVQRRHPIGRILEKTLRKIDELFELFPGTDFFYRKIHLRRDIFESAAKIIKKCII